MRIGIAHRSRLPSPVDKGVAVLRRMDGIHHDRVISAGGILHACRDFHPAGREPVLLVLHGPGSDRHIGKEIIQIFVVFRIQHLIGAGQTGLLDHAHMELSGGDNASEHIRFFLRIRLMQQALIAVSGRPGLIGVDPGDDHNMILYLFLDIGKAPQIIHDTDFIVRGAGAYDQQELIAPAGKDLSDLRISLLFDPVHISGQGIHLLDLHRDRQLPFKIHIHNQISLRCSLPAVFWFLSFGFCLLVFVFWFLSSVSPGLSRRKRILFISCFFILFLDKIGVPLRGETHFVFQAFAVVVCQKAPEL